MILFANGWHCINIGDIAHAPGLVSLLDTHLPSIDLTLWPVPTIRPGRPRDLSPSVRRMLQSAFPRLDILQAGGTSERPATRPDLVDAIDRSDLFIVGSGGMHAAPLDVWRATTDKPYGVCGVTFGEIPDALRDTLEGAAFIYCRDSVSLEILDDAGLRGPHIGFGPDTTFAFSLRDEERADRFLAAHGLEPGSYICVVPRHRFSPYHAIYDDTPTERDLDVDRINAEHEEADHASARQLIVNWVRTTGLKVLACPEMTYGVPLAKRQLVDPLPDDVRSHVVWRDSFWLADEAASVYARSVAVVSLDCHSPIIALAAGVPAIHLRVPTDNPHKSRMFADIGLAGWLHELADLSGADLTDLVLAIHRDPASASDKVARAMTFARSRMAAVAASVRSALPA